MTKKSLVVLNVIALLVFSSSMFAQDSSYLMGENICSDGSNETSISIVTGDTSNYYVLFRNGNQVSVKHSNSLEPKKFKFGSFSEPGVYLSKKYSYTDTIYDINKGKEVSGEVVIYKAPSIIAEETEFEIKSGEVFSYVPKSDVDKKPHLNNGDLSTNNPKYKSDKVEYLWTAKLIEGKLEKFYEKGRGIIVIPYKVQGNSPAVIEFTIKPFSNNEEGGCYGELKNIILTVLPSKI